jgi:hypothetical protein
LTSPRALLTIIHAQRKEEVMRILASLALVVGLALVLVGCQYILPPQEFEPTGTQFNINSSIDVKDIAGATTGYDPTGLFTVEMKVTSLSSGTVSDILPAGLLFRSSNSAVQHMILVRDHPVAAPAGHDTTISVGVFCCNSSRAVPNDSDHYTVGPVTDNSDLRTIVSITKHKALGVTNVNLVQEAVWSVTDGTGLTQGMIDSLNALPEGLPGRSAAAQVRGPIPPGFFEQRKAEALARRTKIGDSR